jgi:hypothetical protein
MSYCVVPAQADSLGSSLLRTGFSSRLVHTVSGNGAGSAPRVSVIPYQLLSSHVDRLCGLVVRVLGYRSGGPGSIPGTTRKKVVGLERGPLSLVSTN